LATPLREAPECRKRGSGRRAADEGTTEVRLRVWPFGPSLGRFPDDDGRGEFAAIEATLSARDEVFEGEGSVSTTAFVMDDAEAEALRDRIVALAARCCKDEH
jgi:hypothetical protein